MESTKIKIKNIRCGYCSVSNLKSVLPNNQSSCSRKEFTRPCYRFHSTGQHMLAPVSAEMQQITEQNMMECVRVFYLQRKALCFSNTRCNDRQDLFGSQSRRRFDAPYVHLTSAHQCAHFRVGKFERPYAHDDSFSSIA